MTSAEVLEALYRATGLPLVADYYTRLYKAEDVSIRNQPLFEALNRLTDPMRLRWDRDARGGWLRFRSTSFYNDRIKEVPNRLLARWIMARRQHGTLTLDDLCEIAQLPDAQLDGADMADRAHLCYGLAEWDLACNEISRSQLRYLAGFTPAQRQEAMSPTGLAFTKMPLAQQQEFLSMALTEWDEPLQSLDELAGATLKVDYSLPGWYEWRVPGQNWFQWLLPVPPGRRAPRPPVRERTREAALEAARRTPPQVLEALVHAARRFNPQLDEARMVPQEAQIVPTSLDLTVVYIPSSSHTRLVRWFSANGGDTINVTWD